MGWRPAYEVPMLPNLGTLRVGLAGMTHHAKPHQDDGVPVAVAHTVASKNTEPSMS